MVLDIPGNGMPQIYCSQLIIDYLREVCMVKLMILGILDNIHIMQIHLCGH